jgi:hypothetical protein
MGFLLSSSRRILDGVESMPTWTADELVPLLGKITSSIPALRLEWDLGAGEGWTRLLLGDDLCATVRAPTTANAATRFAFLRGDCPTYDGLAQLLNGAHVEQVVIDDFEDASFYAEVSDLASFVDGRLPPKHVFDPSSFAASDLVFVSE